MAVAERLSVDVGRPAGRSARNALLVAGGIALLAAILRLADARGIPQIQNFLLVFSSLLIEALPFILLGAVVSAAIEVFVPARAFARVGRLPAPLQMPLAGLG